MEFLTPLTGSDSDRQGRRKATTQIAGVSSQRLRHLEILLHHPWSVEFASGDFKAMVQIANPVSFLVQKVLIHEQRQREDRAKDILYMHDTIELFGARLHELRQLWDRMVAPALHARTARVVSKASVVLFGNLSDDIRRAAQVSDRRGLSPAAIREACEYGFHEVFG